MYDDPQVIRYEIGTDAPFTVAASNKSYIGPKGKKGVVRDVEVYVTTSLVGTTTVPEVVVGSAAQGSQYARFRLGTTAIAGYPTPAVAPQTNPMRASTLVQNKNEVGAATLPGKQSLRYSEHVILEKAYIPADTPFFISVVIGVGAPAGAGVFAVEIEWF